MTASSEEVCSGNLDIPQRNKGLETPTCRYLLMYICTYISFGKHLLLVRICTQIPIHSILRRSKEHGARSFVCAWLGFPILFFWRIQGWLPLALFEPSNRIHVHGMAVGLGPI